MSGIVFEQCRGERLDDTPRYSRLSAGSAINIGGSGWIVIGLHLRASQIPDPERHGFLVQGPKVSYYCLERIHDGVRRDVAALSIAKVPTFERLNAMETLARVKRGHGEATTREPGEA